MLAPHHNPIRTPDGVYSEMQVLRSAAGWYLGRTFQEDDNSSLEPGSRETDYFPNEEEAEVALASNNYLWRDAPELHQLYKGEGQ